MTPFRWHNCYVDFTVFQDERTVKSNADDVTLPALSLLDRRIEDLGESRKPQAAFEKGDVEHVLRETKWPLAGSAVYMGAAIKPMWGKVGPSFGARDGQISRSETSAPRPVMGDFRDFMASAAGA